jgi:hypothetical protein
MASRGGSPFVPPLPLVIPSGMEPTVGGAGSGSSQTHGADVPLTAPTVGHGYSNSSLVTESLHDHRAHPRSWALQLVREPPTTRSRSLSPTTRSLPSGPPAPPRSPSRARARTRSLLPRGRDTGTATATATWGRTTGTPCLRTRRSRARARCTSRTSPRPRSRRRGRRPRRWTRRLCTGTGSGAATPTTGARRRCMAGVWGGVRGVHARGEGLGGV